MPTERFLIWDTQKHEAPFNSTYSSKWAALRAAAHLNRTSSTDRYAVRPVDIKLSKCADCGRQIAADDDECFNAEVELICPSCDEDYSRCFLCEDIFKNNDVAEYDGCYYCSECLSEVAFTCDECNGLAEMNEQNFIGYNGSTVCKRCYTDNYFLCDRCEINLPNSRFSGSGRCDNCDCETKESATFTLANSKSYRPVFWERILPDST